MNISLGGRAIEAYCVSRVQDIHWLTEDISRVTILNDRVQANKQWISVAKSNFKKNNPI